MLQLQAGSVNVSLSQSQVRQRSLVQRLHNVLYVLATTLKAIIIKCLYKLQLKPSPDCFVLIVHLYRLHLEYISIISKWTTPLCGYITITPHDFFKRNTFYTKGRIKTNALVFSLSTILEQIEGKALCSPCGSHDIHDDIESSKGRNN